MNEWNLNKQISVELRQYKYPPYFIEIIVLENIIHVEIQHLDASCCFTTYETAPFLQLTIRKKTWQGKAKRSAFYFVLFDIFVWSI